MSVPSLPPVLAGYPQPRRAGAWDEAVDRAEPARARDAYRPLAQALGPVAGSDLLDRAEALTRGYTDQGITFSHSGQDRPFPLDPFPRILDAAEWSTLERGLVQRVRALEMFLGDVYGAQQILADRVVPRRLVTSCSQFCRQVAGIVPPTGVRVHVAGIDVIRDGAGTLRVLEDNLRSPSGVSYVMENRRAMASVFPELFDRYPVSPVQDYGFRLLGVLRAAAPASAVDPTVVVLTPGVYSAAYFEHSLLARHMGVELVEGRDLVVRGTTLYLRTTVGEQRVDVVYRRVDDEFLDPLHFDGDSVLGVAGLLGVVRAGNVVLANAVGNGVADDKGIYTYVPDMVRYYLGEEPLLPNVETVRCWVPEERADALSRMDELVFKPVEGYGGHGIVFGPDADERELAALRARVEADPRGWIAQPVLDLSTVPTLVGDRLAPRHVDFRPFVLNDGASTWVLPGGLTRVALPADSLVVNSSQGGGSKDTWVLADPVTALPAPVPAEPAPTHSALTHSALAHQVVPVPSPGIDLGAPPHSRQHDADQTLRRDQQQQQQAGPATARPHRRAAAGGPAC